MNGYVASDTSMRSRDAPHIRSLRTPKGRLTAHEVVRETLRRAILRGDLPGGTRLIQAKLAVQLNVSNTPVREALRDLAAEQLIRFYPHRGAVVHTLDVSELREIYEIRMALEPLAIRLAASRITRKQLKEASELLARMDTETDPGAWVEKNRKFHTLLENAAQSPRLALVVKGVQDSAALYVAYAVHVDPSRIAQGNADHRALLAALRAGDADGAAELQRQHLDTSLHAIPAATRSEFAAASSR
jgi:DNA-binding GntR family transcriptional regulator